MILNDPIAWPPILPTARAAAYCSVDRTTLTRAAAAGELKPYGRRGRTMTWSRDELDRWLKGERPATTRQAMRAGVVSPPSVSAALDRIRRTARGG